MKPEQLELFYIAEEFEVRSARLVSAFYDSGTKNSVGWSLLPDKLAKGAAITIRPATESELAWAKRELNKWGKLRPSLEAGRGLDYYDRLISKADASPMARPPLQLKQRGRTFPHKLLCDEGILYRQALLQTQKRFDIKNVESDLRLSNLADDDLFALAAREGRLILTDNERDFSKLANWETLTGVIFVDGDNRYSDVDGKLLNLLERSSHDELYGKVTHIKGPNL